MSLSITRVVLYKHDVVTSNAKPKSTAAPCCRSRSSKPKSASPDEKELRGRYLKTLNSQEDKLEQIDKDAQQQIEARDACREKMNAILAKLE